MEPLAVDVIDQAAGNLISNLHDQNISFDAPGIHADKTFEHELDCINEAKSTDINLCSEAKTEDFHEVVPLLGDFNLSDKKNIECRPLSKDLLPSIVYLVVDRAVELDSRTLSEFPELGMINEEEKSKQGICLFENQRSAKRHCGRNQRVIKIPDTNVLHICKPFLLARGITRLILEGTLISLDDAD